MRLKRWRNQQDQEPQHLLGRQWPLDVPKHTKTMTSETLIILLRAAFVALKVLNFDYRNSFQLL